MKFEARCSRALLAKVLNLIQEVLAPEKVEQQSTKCDLTCYLAFRSSCRVVSGWVGAKKGLTSREAIAGIIDGETFPERVS